MSLMRRRRALMAASRTPIIPKEYQRVEYIECSGSQYIETDYTIGTPDELICKSIFMPTNVFGDHPIVWAYGTDSSNAEGTYKFPNVYNGKIEIQGYGIKDGNAFSVSVNEFVEMGFNYKPGEQIVKKNELSKSYTNTKPTRPGTKPILLLRSNKTGGANVYFIGRLYYFYLFVDGTIIFNMIPCYRKSDNEIGMYDLVSKTFLTNAGTGTFTKGADV